MSLTPEFAPRTVSVVNEFPEDLYEAMRNFVRSHPNWDQYRLMQVALAGFLFQQGSRERAVSRHYLDGLFDRGGSPEASAAGACDPGGAVQAPRSAPAAVAQPAGSGVWGPSAEQPHRTDSPGREAGRRQDSAALPSHGGASGRPAAALPPQSHRQGSPLPPQRLR